MIDNCPNCNTSLNKEDIYQYFLDKYTKNRIFYHTTTEEVLGLMAKWPELYKDAPSEAELRAMSHLELNAWATAHNYGWSKANPRCFRKEIGIEMPEIYDGVILWKCPDCGHIWKRFDWVKDEVLEKYQNSSCQPKE